MAPHAVSGLTSGIVVCLAVKRPTCVIEVAPARPAALERPVW